MPATTLFILPVWVTLNITWSFISNNQIVIGFVKNEIVLSSLNCKAQLTDQIIWSATGPTKENKFKKSFPQNRFGVDLRNQGGSCFKV